MGELEDSTREKEKEICVDTDVLIDFLRGKGPGSLAYKQWRNEASSVVITAVTAFELLMGARGSEQSEKRYEEARSLIEQQGNVLPFDKSSAEMASEIGAELRKQGKGIEIRDLFNSSICVNLGIPLLTKNREHYQRVTGLKLIPV